MTPVSICLKGFFFGLTLAMLAAHYRWPALAWPCGMVAGFSVGFIAFASNRMTWTTKSTRIDANHMRR